MKVLRDVLAFLLGMALAAQPMLARATYVEPVVVTPAMCGMKPEPTTTPAERKGTVTIRFIWAAPHTECGPITRYYGCTSWEGKRTTVLIEMRDAPPAFNDICALARLGHEVLHAMGAMHEAPK